VEERYDARRRDILPVPPVRMIVFLLDMAVLLHKILMATQSSARWKEAASDFRLNVNLCMLLGAHEGRLVLLYAI